MSVYLATENQLTCDFTSRNTAISHATEAHRI
jgi:hypothetical protein